MKKYLLIGLLTMALVLPLTALAGDEIGDGTGGTTPPAVPIGPTECCKLVRPIKLDNSNDLKKGDIVGSDEPDTVCPLGAITQATNKWGIACFINMMNIVINWIFVFLIVLVILLTMIGAFLLMTAGGNEENVTKGRKYIMWAAVGLIVALVARAVPSIVTSVFG